LATIVGKGLKEQNLSIFREVNDRAQAAEDLSTGAEADGSGA
jgi:hypothetical protein